MLRLLATLLALGMMAPSRAEEAVLGRKPDYQGKPLSEVPNGAALTRRSWAPGLDRGYTPQGLAVSGGRVHVVGYGADGCRLFSLDARGGTTREIHVPACRHGGGLAALPGGRFVVIDTRALFVIENGQLARRIALQPPLTGSFGDFDGRDLWIGRYVREGTGTIWRLPLAALSRESLSESDTAAKRTIPGRAQGMAFGAGGLWLTFSGARFGRLSRIDSETGQELARYEMPAGIEDIGVDSAGLIWAVSEAGARKYTGWDTNFPLVFAIDPARLR